MQIFLIHGMGRTSVSLALLARRLRAAGHQTSSFGYLVSRHSLQDIGDQWVQHIERHRRGSDAEFGVLGHSLGNIITRSVLPRLPQLTRFMMLAPPNRPPRLARTMDQRAFTRPIFRLLTQDAGQKLNDDGGFYAALPVPTMPTLIVAGSGGPRFASTPWTGADNDGVVAVDETRLPESVAPAAAHPAEHVVVDAIHTLIMNHSTVTRLALQFFG